MLALALWWYLGSTAGRLAAFAFLIVPGGFMRWAFLWVEMGASKSPIRVRYRNRLRAEREKAGLNPKELAGKMRVSDAHLFCVERNHAFLTIDFALNACEALGCKLDDLYERVEA